MWRASLQSAAVLIPRVRSRLSCSRIEKRSSSAFTQEVVSPQRQLERSPMYSSRIRLPESMAPSLRSRYQDLNQHFSVATEAESTALLENYIATIKELLAGDHLVEAAELMSVVPRRLPHAVNDAQYLRLFDIAVVCCTKMSLNTVSIRFLDLVVPIMRQAKEISLMGLHHFFYSVNSCGAFKHLPNLMDAAMHHKASITQTVLMQLIRMVLLYGQKADIEKLENFVHDFELYKRDDVLVTYMRKLSERDSHRTLAVYLKYRNYLESVDSDTLSKILDKVSQIVFKLGFVPVADDVLTLIRSRGIFSSMAANHLVQFYFKFGDSTKAENLVREIRASGAPYTSNLYLSLADERADDIFIQLMGKAFDDPECQILPGALVSAISYFSNVNDEGTAISTFMKLASSEESIIQLRSVDIRRLLTFVNLIASKFETFATTLVEQSRRDQYSDVLTMFCNFVLLLPWRKRSGAGSGVNPRPFVVNTLLRLLGCIGPTKPLMDALDKLLDKNPAISSITILTALRYAVALDVITASFSEAFIQRHKLQATRKEYNRFQTSGVIPEFVPLWKRISGKMRALDPIYSAQLVQAQGIRIPTPEELPE